MLNNQLPNKEADIPFKKMDRLSRLAERQKVCGDIASRGGIESQIAQEIINIGNQLDALIDEAEAFLESTKRS